MCACVFVHVFVHVRACVRACVCVYLVSLVHVVFEDDVCVLVPAGSCVCVCVCIVSLVHVLFEGDEMRVPYRAVLLTTQARLQAVAVFSFKTGPGSGLRCSEPRRGAAGQQRDITTR